MMDINIKHKAQNLEILQGNNDNVLLMFVHPSKGLNAFVSMAKSAVRQTLGRMYSSTAGR